MANVFQTYSNPSAARRVNAAPNWPRQDGPADVRKGQRMARVAGQSRAARAQYHYLAEALKELEFHLHWRLEESGQQIGRASCRERVCMLV